MAFQVPLKIRTPELLAGIYVENRAKFNSLLFWLYAQDLGCWHCPRWLCCSLSGVTSRAAVGSWYSCGYHCPPNGDGLFFVQLWFFDVCGSSMLVASQHVLAVMPYLTEDMPSYFFFCQASLSCRLVILPKKKGNQTFLWTDWFFIKPYGSALNSPPLLLLSFSRSFVIFCLLMSDVRLNSRSYSAADTESACSHSSGICMVLQDLYTIVIRKRPFCFFTNINTNSH